MNRAVLIITRNIAIVQLSGIVRDNERNEASRADIATGNKSTAKSRFRSASRAGKQREQIGMLCPFTVAFPSTLTRDRDRAA